MQFTSLLFTTLLTLTSAVPLAPRTPTPQTGTAIDPSDISTYHVSTGAIDFNVAEGKVSKTGDGRDITTLISFEIPPAAVGKTLTFHFDLDSTAVVTGSGLLDVYRSLGPATQSTTGWGQGVPGNQRDQHLGRLKVAPGSEGVYLTAAEGFPQTASAFLAPATEGKIGFELVGVYDKDTVTWNEAVASAYLTYA